jgi:aminoglycoside 6'-N-acetyltransferase
MVHFEDGRLRVRDWSEADIPSLTRRLSDPRVLRYVGGRDDVHDEARMRAIYHEAGDDVRCIIELDGAPLGYIQFCPSVWEQFDFSPARRVWGIDVYIGEPDFWHRGIGTQVVRGSAEYLLASCRADCVTIDPESWNTRAIRSYEKAGFAKWRLVPRAELHEGELRDAWLMVYGLPVPRVERLTEWPGKAVEPLISEAKSLGFDFVRRLRDDYLSGANRFDKPGEGLFATFADGALTGIGGLNMDHYARDPSIGRVRHLYVMASHRRQGIGRALATAIMSAAIAGFSSLRLRTLTAEGRRFYEALGFERLRGGHEATHALRFSPRPE